MPASVGQGVGPGRVVALQQLLDPARPESRHLRRRSDRMALRQQPDHLHVTGLDRIRAGPETSLQFQNIQVIRDAPHGRALQQDLKPNPISARRESAPNESMSRTPYQWSDAEKARIVEETLVLGVRVAEVARRNAVSASLVFGWRRLARDGLLGRGVPALMPVEIVAPASTLPAPAPSVAPRPKRLAGLIEIELSQGRRLRVGRDVDGDALRRVLDALDRR